MAAISITFFQWLTYYHVMTLKTMAIDGNQWDTIQGMSMQNKIILNMNNYLSSADSSLISNGDNFTT
jgi:hypothetical protein